MRLFCTYRTQRGVCISSDLSLLCTFLSFLTFGEYSHSSQLEVFITTNIVKKKPKSYKRVLLLKYSFSTRNCSKRCVTLLYLVYQIGYLLTEEVGSQTHLPKQHLHRIQLHLHLLPQLQIYAHNPRPRDGLEWVLLQPVDAVRHPSEQVLADGASVVLYAAPAALFVGQHRRV
ncbi:hypothetical protein B0T25DRAFT_527392 [Lasiosphaeria hispida]|uniref:Uncharacterized protein n=1 Tax=Lasiosphaeria hispida TaxID=260671 RepID=A0AAJ0HVC0_9PEZI|nr:hypothetical protein B0T25DRAFT_527392 [Lasiosphaeria hispida]